MGVSNSLRWNLFNGLDLNLLALAVYIKDKIAYSLAPVILLFYGQKTKAERSFLVLRWSRHSNYYL